MVRPQCLLVGTATARERFGPRLELPDGKIIQVGQFRGFDGRIMNSLVRLNADESVDETFRSGQGFLIGNVPSGWQAGDPGSIDQLHSIANGQILVVGFFQEYDGANVRSPLILNADGSRDTGFEISDFEVPWDTSIIPAGDAVWLPPIAGQLYFTTGFGIGRLNMNLPLRIVSTTRDVNSTTHLTANALTGRSYTLQSTETLTNWSDLITQTASTNWIEFTDAPTNSPAHRFYRVKQD